MKKKLFSLVLSLAVCISAISPVYATSALSLSNENSQNCTLSQLPDSELLSFLEKNGCTIPAGLAESQSQALESIRSIIADIEEKPDIEFTYNLVQLSDLAYTLRSIVNDYYGISGESVFQPYSSHGLRDSSVYQVPSNMQNYNCYSYALGITTNRYNPGNFSGRTMTQTTLKNRSISEIAQYVKYDLNSPSLNKQCVKITYTRPSYSSLRPGQTAICVRKGDDNYGFYDYHFMKLFSGNTWRHKPGKTAILTYDHLPSTSRKWTSEAYDGQKVIPGNIVYDSNICYILFQSSHSYSHLYTGKNYHSGSRHYYEYADICTGCGNQKANTTTWSSIACNGSPCPDVMSLRGTDR